MLLSRYLSRNHLVITSKPLYCHPVLSLYPATCQVFGVNSPSNILLLPRLVVEYSVLSLSISPESYSGISVMVLPLSVHAEYPCVPLGSQVLGVNRRVSPPLYPTLFTFLLKNLQIRKFCCTFAPESSTPVYRGWEMSPLGKPTRLPKHPSRGFQDILKRRLLALCSDL